MSHGCIGNPCWICYPEYAPKHDPWPQILQDRIVPEQGISGRLRELLESVFRQGLDEDTHYRAIGDMTLEDLKLERTHVTAGSLEAQLLDLMIEDFENKGWEPKP